MSIKKEECAGCTTRKIVFMMLAVFLATGLVGSATATWAIQELSEIKERTTRTETKQESIADLQKETRETLSKLSDQLTLVIMQGENRNNMIANMTKALSRHNMSTNARKEQL